MLKIKKRGIKSFLSAAIFCFGLSLVFSLSIQAQNDANVGEMVKSLSGGKLKVEAKAVPYQLKGDFNGDKIEDVAVIVSLADTIANITKAVKTEYPYYYKEVDAGDLALFIIHGKGKGWQSEQKSSVLFLGRSSTLIFQKSRLGETGDGMELDKDKRGKQSIYFVTEGSGGTMKWNGKKYVWTESEP